MSIYIRNKTQAQSFSQIIRSRDLHIELEAKETGELTYSNSRNSFCSIYSTSFGQILKANKNNLMVDSKMLQNGETIKLNCLHKLTFNQKEYLLINTTAKNEILANQKQYLNFCQQSSFQLEFNLAGLVRYYPLPLNIPIIVGHHNNTDIQIKLPGVADQHFKILVKTNNIEIEALTGKVISTRTNNDYEIKLVEAAIKLKLTKIN